MNNTNEATENVVPIAKTRTKSPETLLKAELKTIKKELDGITKTAADFDKLKKEVEGNAKRKEELNTKLADVKAKLLKELGLE